MMSDWNQQLAFYDRIIELHPDIERKGKTVPCTTANGYMFSQLNKAGEIGIRLSKTRAKAFMEKHEDSGIFKSYGAVMRDYVLIPISLYDDIDYIVKILDEGYRHVLSLPTKNK